MTRQPIQEPQLSATKNASAKLSYGYGRDHRAPELPAAGLQQFFRIELSHVETAHGLAELFGSFEHGLRIFEMRGRFDDGPRALVRVAGLENSRSDEDSFGPQLPDQSGVGRRGDAAGREIRNGQPALLRHFANQFQRR